VTTAAQAPPGAAGTRWYALGAGEVAAKLGVDPEQGLTPAAKWFARRSLTAASVGESPAGGA